MEKEAPVTVGIYMSDFLSATNMQDNVQQLAQLEKHFAQLSRKPRNYVLEAGASRLGEQYQSKPKGFNTFEAAGYGLLSGLNSGKRGLQTVLNDFLTKMNYESYISEDVQKQLHNASDEAILELAASFYHDDEGARNNLINMYKGYRDAFVKQATDLFENAPKWLEKAQQTGGINEFIFDVSAGIAQLAPMVAASVATGGGTVAPFLTGLVMNYGQTLDQYRQDPLALQENAREAAMINAFLSAPLDAFGAKGIGKAFIKPKTATGHALKTWLTGAGHEGVTEYAQAYPELLAKQYAYGKFDNFEWSAIGGFLNEAFSADFQKDALYQGAVGAAAGGSLGAFGIKSEYKNKAKQITGLVEAQKLAKEQPEIFKNLVGQLKNGGVDIPDIYVPASAVEALRQERSAELTDFDKQPLDVFLDEAGISHEEYGFAAASGGSLQISGENIHKAMQTSIGGRLLQNDAFSISSEFATDGMDSFLGALYQQKEKIDNLSKAVEAQQSQTQEINSDFDEYTESMLKDEAELSPEMFAEVQNVQAVLDTQFKAYNEENYLTQQIANDIEENTKLTDNPYNETQSKTLASLFMAEIKTYAENYNMPLQEAYKQRRPLFLGNVASTQDIDTLIARAKQEAGFANFNKDAVERENALYQQREAERIEAEQKLQSDLQAWEKTVDKFESGELNPRQSVTMLNNTPLILSLLGADKDLTVSTNYRTLNKVLHEKHKLPADVMKQVPKAMTDPIMIFKSATVANDYVMMLDLKDEHGANVVVPVSLNYDGIGGYKVNYALSIYGKKNEKTNKPNNKWFINQIEQGNLVYQNNKKSREWLKSSGLQLPRVGLGPLNGKNQSILTDKDLSSAKTANPAYYQEQPVIQGSITPVEGAKSIIRFFKATDISTGFHEFGHYMQFAMEQKARLENAREQDIQDWTTACDFVGAKQGEAWTREQHEKFADAVLEYLHSGEAPSKGLKRVFANIARWLTKLYEKILHSGVEINPQLKEVFDRQLATEKEILAARQKLGIAETNPILSSVQERDLAFLSPEKREQFNALAQDSDIDAYSAMTEKKGKELEEHKKIWNSNAELAYQLDKDTVLLEQIMDEGGIYIDEDLREQYRESLVETHRQRPIQYNAIFTSDKNKSVDIELAAERFGFEGAGAVDSFMGYLASLPNKERFIAEYVAEHTEQNIDETVCFDVGRYMSMRLVRSDS
jgi:hypothetical protein